MPILKSPLAKARDAVTDAEENLERWQTRLDGDRTTLAELEATMGADVLAAADDTEVDAIRERLLKVRTSIDVATAAVGSAEGAVVDARRQVLAAAASLVRSRAKDLRSDAEKHADRTRALLDQLAEHEQLASDVQYRPVVFSELRGWDVVRTRSDVLASEADALDQLAEEIDTAANRPQLDAESVRRLVAKADPEGPEAAELAERRDRQAQVAEAARAYERDVIAARKAWIAARAKQLHDAENTPLAAAEGQAMAELNAQRRQHPSQQPDGPTTNPVDIDAWALERLGVNIDRPAVLAAA